MEQIRSGAMVLMGRSVSDADRSLLLCTEKLGMVWVRAKGVRKPTSRLASNLLQFLPLVVELARGSGGWVVTGAKVVDASLRYPTDPRDFLDAMSTVARLVKTAVPEGAIQPEVFIQLSEGVPYILHAPDPVLAEAEYLLKVLRVLGHAPELAMCALSGESLSSEDNLGWSAQHGGVIKDVMRDPSASAITVDQVKVLRLLSGDEWVSPRLSVVDNILIRGMVRRYAEYQIG